eukprot:2473997-Prorocentrum_lima.AAC.1
MRREQKGTRGRDRREQKGMERKVVCIGFRLAWRGNGNRQWVCTEGKGKRRGWDRRQNGEKGN